MSKERPFVDFLKNNYSGKLRGVEIGVFQGDNAELMLQKLDIEKLYLVDPYIAYDGYDVGSLGAPLQVANIEKYFDYTQKRLSPFGEKVQFIRRKSSEAIFLIPDGLDFVYIDANHKYEYVWEDISLYFPKIRKGGILGGDNLELPDVARAVIEFIKKNALKIQGAGWSIAYEWWCVK